MRKGFNILVTAMAEPPSLRGILPVAVTSVWFTTEPEALKAIEILERSKQLSYVVEKLW